MDPQRKTIDELIDKALDTLSEHCDSVRIFVTARCENDNTQWIDSSEGRGNIYAQIGQVDDWLIRMRELTKINEREGSLMRSRPHGGDDAEDETPQET